MGDQMGDQMDEQLCWSYGHLDPNERLADRIKMDEHVPKTDVISRLNRIASLSVPSLPTMMSFIIGVPPLPDHLVFDIGEGWYIRCWTLIVVNDYEIYTLYYGGFEQCACNKNRRPQGLSDKEYYIFDRKTGKQLKIGHLLLHQIEEHGFYQSPSSSYRLDPQHFMDFTSRLDRWANISEDKDASNEIMRKARIKMLETRPPTVGEYALNHNIEGYPYIMHDEPSYVLTKVAEDKTLYSEAIKMVQSTEIKIVFYEAQIEAGPIPRICDLLCDVVSLDGTPPVLTITHIGYNTLENPVSGCPGAADVFSGIGMSMTVDRPIKFLAGIAKGGVRRSLAQCPLQYKDKALVAELCRSASVCTIM